jgi:hypothetical protein
MNALFPSYGRQVKMSVRSPKWKSRHEEMHENFPANWWRACSRRRAGIGAGTLIACLRSDFKPSLS